jgi:hypothetical protein
MDPDPARPSGRRRGDLGRRPRRADRAGQRDHGHVAVGHPAPSQEELLASVALDIQAMTQHKQNPLGDFKPRGGQ